MRSLTINIVCFELAAVMVYRTFTEHNADRSFHIFPFSGVSRGSVTLVKSNAKALLTAAPSKMQPASRFCALRGARAAL
jgi:hypothetical protein